MSNKRRFLITIFVIIIIVLCVYVWDLNAYLYPNEDNYPTAMTLIRSLDDKYDYIPSDIFLKVKSPPNKIAKAWKENEAEYKKLENSRNRLNYGGGGVDPVHLGGFKHNDTKSYDRELWEYIIPLFNVSSVIDIGCGMGYSTIFFASKIRKYIKNWNDVMCIEGSHDAIQQSYVKNITIQHDYSLGPFWPDRIYDMAWSVEFLEHVNESYMDNYMSTFKKAKMIVMSASPVGGWSHLNPQKKEYWIDRFTEYGFIYDDKLTRIARKQCVRYPTVFSNYTYHGLTNTKYGNNTFRQSYFSYNGLVFFNAYFYKNLTNEDLRKFTKLTTYDKLVLTQFGKY